MSIYQQTSDCSTLSKINHLVYSVSFFKIWLEVTLRRILFTLLRVLPPYFYTSSLIKTGFHLNLISYFDNHWLVLQMLRLVCLLCCPFGLCVTFLFLYFTWQILAKLFLQAFSPVVRSNSTNLRCFTTLSKRWYDPTESLCLKYSFIFIFATSSVIREVNDSFVTHMLCAWS